jgi:hypothetical protein
MRLRELDNLNLTVVPKGDSAPSAPGHGGEPRLHVELSDPFREYESGRQLMQTLSASLRTN